MFSYKHESIFTGVNAGQPVTHTKPKKANHKDQTNESIIPAFF